MPSPKQHGSPAFLFVKRALLLPTPFAHRHLQVAYASQPMVTRIAIPSHADLESITSTPTTVPVHNSIAIPTHPQIDETLVRTATATTSVAHDPIPIPKHPTIESTVNIAPVEQKPDPFVPTTPSFFTPSVTEQSTTMSPPSPTNSEAQARAVPTTRIGRLASFGSLAAGLGVGALGSLVRSSIGGTRRGAIIANSSRSIFVQSECRADR